MVGVLVLSHASGASAGVTLWTTGTGTETSLLAKLQQRGIEIDARSIDELTTSRSLPSGRTNTWVFATTQRFPARALERVHEHLAQGGELLVLGGVPFKKLTYQDKGRWLTQQEYLRKVTTATTLFPLLTAEECLLSHDHHTTGAALTQVPGSYPHFSGAEIPALHMNVPLFASWCTFRRAAPAAMPSGDLTTFWAKGTTDTKKLAIEWQERDGSRWIATVDLSPDWQYYVLKPGDFDFWVDNISRGRGGPSDKVNLQNVHEFAVGLAQTHTKLSHGPHDFWIADVGVAVSDGELRDLLVEGEIDGLYSQEKLYPMAPESLEVNPAYAGLAENLQVPPKAWSPYWRPMGSGIDKARRHRFIPVVTANNKAGERAGTVASMTLHFDGQTSGAITGSIGIPDPEVLMSDEWIDIAAEMILRMQDRLFFAEAGSTEFCYDTRDLDETPLVVGYEVIEREQAGEATDTDVITTLSAVHGDIVSTTSERLVSRARQRSHVRSVEDKLDVSGKGMLLYEVGLVREGKLLDLLSQEIRFERPRTGENEFVAARDHRFWLGDKPWRAFGINYMPSSGLALSHGAEFEYWIEDPSYDPEIIQADLERISGLGFNMVSVFAYSRDNDRLNLLDLLHRCRELGLMVNLSLRPNHNPWPAKKNVTDRLIKEIRAWERDEIMGYDVAWEPWWGNGSRRMKYKDAWVQWVIEEYGSAKAAGEAWDFEPEALAEFPSDMEMNVDGPWREAVKDYRRFAHEAIGEAYAETRDNIKALDPNHLVSFRQSEGGNPLVAPSTFPVELAPIADAVDFFSPEGYGIGDAPEKAQTFWFTTAYAQGLSPGKPVLLAEYGSSVWSGSSFDTDALLYQRQAQVYENIFNAAEAARSAGTVLWWFPGGYRKYEESDYGVLNPDGTDRPGTRLVREWADRLKEYPPPVKWQGELVGDADGVRGYVGLYEELKDAFYDRASTGTLPVVRRADTR